VFRFDPVGAWVFKLQFLTRTLDGSVGDADLYVARGRIPTMNDYDCRPYTSLSDEQCTIPAAQLNGGSNIPFYVMVRGYTPYFSVELQVLQNMLHAGESSASFGMSQGTGVIFTFPDMPGTVSLGAASPAAYGDADLFAACGKVPFLDPANLGNFWAIPMDFEVASTGGSFTEAVALPGTRGHGRPARCFGLVKGYTNYGNLKITAPAWNPG